ncbi:uncharacterized protein LOC114529904, partial [Dendronephthya gigantea]|uniref:uncharacterized protein LOC114529904 n=1 Tax=Dendronephthya gigantea TaxID=151771 RepID=UPI00106BE494
MLSRGRQDYSQWVTAFTISYSNDEISFSDYMENGLKRVFIANFDRVTTVKQHLVNEIFARYVRVYCTKNHDKAAIRIEFLGCSCDSTWRHSDALGIENLSILDSQLTASSSQYYNATASNARLNLKTTLSSYGAWIAAKNDNNPWLQVDFITNVTITAIATQGLDGGQHWVKEYSIGFGPDNVLFTNYEENGKTKIFPANFDSRSTKRHDIYPNILARFIRVTATACAGYCALRVEFYGRYEACEIKSYLGMANHEILDSQITASSVYGNDITAHRASLARINLTQVIGTHYGAWAQHADQNPWLQVDFLVKRIICAVLTQGRQDAFQFVKTYTMHESSDGLNFVEYKDRGAGKIFQANFDMNTIVRQRLQRVIFARFIRIYPKTWHIHLSMRIEFEGCRKAVDDWFNPVPLGIENGLISALQLTASSAQNSSSGAKNSRLNLNTNPERHGGWIAAENDDNPWLQVDFFTNATVTRIDTQGSASSEGRVTSYAASLSTDGLSFQEYKQYDKVKVFLANYKENSTVRQDVVPSFTTRVLRIIPKSWIGNCSLRIEVYGRYEGCREVKGLGVENNKILDSQFSASSEARYGLRPAEARLNLVSPTGGAWRPQIHPNSWLQVDFLRHAKISLILTQGRSNYNAFVTSYLVSYSTNEVDFQYIKEHARDRVFQANFDRNTISYNPLTPSIFTRYIRIHPKTWKSEIGLRIEFKGCYCDVPCPDPESLGMESFHISNNQLTSSSTHDKYSRHTSARLNLVSVTGVRSGGWVASHDDVQPWIRIDFRANVTLRAIQTQGREDADEWVTTYEVSYGTTSNTYDKFHENGQVKVFSANKDRHSVVTQFMFPPLYGRFVRVEPKTWNGKCSIRLEFLGCHEDCSSPEPLGMENKTIRDDQIDASSSTWTMLKGRLNLPSGAAWRANTDDNHPWFQVDFLMVTKVSAIKTQGEDSSNYERYMSHYTLSYCNDGFQFLKYKENGRVKIFNGNGDEKSIVMTRLARTLFSRFVRINPTVWKDSASLRVEFLGCYYGCIHPNVLGMENGQIRDHQISSSSEKSASVSASKARLNKHGAWKPSPDDGNKYLRVDFLYRTIVVSVTTQGFVDAWASDYSLAYKENFTSFKTYNEDGVKRIFTANTDPDTPVTNFPSPFIAARHVRIRLETSSPLRVEFNGCYEDVDICSSLPCLNGGTCVDIFDIYNSFTCVCLPGFTGVYCESACLEPRSLGMVNGHIKDYQITASSTDRLSSYLANPFEARINNTIFSRCGCWSPQSNSTSEWLQVDFLKQIAVTAVQTQGRNDVDEWVTQYQVSFSQDGTNFVHLMDGYGNIQNFIGNSDRTSIVTRALSPKVVARFIRIHPTSWFTAIALRAEFIGCYTDMTCLFPRPLGMQNGQIKDAQLSSSSVKPHFWDSLRFTTANSRLNNSPETTRWNFWLPLETDTNKWFQVDFIANVTVSAIQT